MRGIRHRVYVSFLLFILMIVPILAQEQAPEPTIVPDTLTASLTPSPIPSSTFTVAPSSSPSSTAFVPSVETGATDEPVFEFGTTFAAQPVAAENVSALTTFLSYLADFETTTLPVGIVRDTNPVLFGFPNPTLIGGGINNPAVSGLYANTFLRNQSTALTIHMSVQLDLGGQGRKVNNYAWGTHWRGPLSALTGKIFNGYLTFENASGTVIARSSTCSIQATAPSPCMVSIDLSLTNVYSVTAHLEAPNMTAGTTAVEWAMDNLRMDTNGVYVPPTQVPVPSATLSPTATASSTRTPTLVPTVTYTPSVTATATSTVIPGGGGGDQETCTAEIYSAVNVRSNPTSSSNNVIGTIAAPATITLNLIYLGTGGEIWFHFPDPAYTSISSSGQAWVAASVVDENSLCNELAGVNFAGATLTPTPMPSPYPTIDPDYDIPDPTTRDVFTEAGYFHQFAWELGLAMPFDQLPIMSNQLDSMQGYGPNLFTWEKAGTGLYQSTHGYHTGLDLFGNDSCSLSETETEPCAEVVAVCDGVIVSGRTDAGASTRLGTSARGLALRCFMDDPLLLDIGGGNDYQGDGFRNLSNIIASYNHLTEHETAPFPEGGDIVTQGQILARTSRYYTCAQGPECNKSSDVYGRSCTGSLCADSQGPNHLHFEVFIARGWKNYGIRLNPLLMFDPDVFSIQGVNARTQLDSWFWAYYPLSNAGNLIETTPHDYNDGDDMDFGILENQLTIWTPSSDITVAEQASFLFWTRIPQNNTTSGVQNITGTPQPEWTTSSLASVSRLVSYLFLDNYYLAGRPYGSLNAPYCLNVANDVTTFPENCSDEDTITNNDASVDIPVFVPR